MVRYSFSGNSTCTEISSPSTCRVVASVPLNIWLTAEPIWDAVKPSAAAMVLSTLMSTMGAVFSMLE